MERAAPRPTAPPRPPRAQAQQPPPGAPTKSAEDGCGSEPRQGGCPWRRGPAPRDLGSACRKGAPVLLVRVELPARAPLHVDVLPGRHQATCAHGAG
eukprot:6853393-Alexandrium_andersonii.AAC.1